METERVPRRGRVAANALLSGMLLVPGLRLPPDEPPASPAPAPRASAPAATRAPTPAAAPVAPRPAPPQAATPPSPFTVPPPAPPPRPPAASPEATAMATGAPAALEDTGVPIPPGTGGPPAPVPRRAREVAAHQPPGTATDVPPAVPWGLLPAVSLLLALLAFAMLRLAAWPGRMVGTARLAMAAPVPATAPVAPAEVTLGAAAQRLPAAVQRDLAELAVLLEDEGFTAPE